MHRYIVSLLLLLLPLSGCGALLKTDFTPPETTTPAQWTASAAEVSPAATWPTDFGDPALTRLVALALERNNDLAAAAIKVRKAQYQAGLAWEDMTPNLSASLGTDSEKSLKRGGWDTDYSAKFGISWEADLWGRLSSARDSAEWEALATEQDRQGTALSLVGTTMKLYWGIAYDNVRLQLSESNIESSRQTLALTESQERWGAASSLEVNQSRQDLASLLATNQTLRQARQEDINALAVLFDMPPGKTMADPETLSMAALPPIPAGLPAQLLGRRPDLRAAELRLREYLADTDAAKADFYPPLTLTGSLGSASTELSDLLNNPVAALVSSLTFPFLNWNTLQLQLKVSQADFDEAVVNFRQTLYEAMKEVEDALSNRDRLAERANHLAENLTAAREVERIYEVRYKAGSGTLKDWLDAQDTRRIAEQSAAENLYSRLTNYVTLYQALGGEPPRTETVAQTK
ncbi:RND efflux system, outer membrane lipoprotein, NodT family [Pseudodesulfovibrio mercurii]|uniref:RND efflux system, outer membrane lipoprotein, NodT family n=1 Tax=Pseudodesulfovibrio mercurii TaxID=641491 RepID=F0JCX8_9BACT|nr:efflux transporter outer membrane subunit [Pseudodesulfovibrio mercurii]EGB13306.1 RND efflux system, outer membrane lipoprotein, NodT family [Pseudodesulfovibrio mercurii]